MSSMAKTYSIKKSQKIPLGINAAWNFFSKPDNLKKIMPDNIRFISAPLEGSPIYVGQIIEYKMVTRFLVPIKWVTEIMEVDEKRFFIDEQRKGPFKHWRHQHFFIEIPGGVIMTDIIQYKCPLGWASNLLNTLYFRRRLNQIYDYRAIQLVKLFGEYMEPKYHWGTRVNVETGEAY
jgi:ligand-binding SRPBCC domain-containing protein